MSGITKARPLLGRGRAFVLMLCVVVALGADITVVPKVDVGRYPYPMPIRVFPRDDRGIDLVVREDGKSYYNPVTISQQALGYYERWQWRGAATDFAEFRKRADWLVRAQTRDGLWLYHFPNCGMPVPWWSAMAQGQGMSVLVRAHLTTGLSSYKTAAAKALSTFRRTIADRGVTSVENGYLWLEEALPPCPSKHILNGMIFALFGVIDYQTAYRDDASRRIRNRTLTTLADKLPLYDSGTWSYYNLNGSLTNVFYHQVHVDLLRALHRWTGRKTFKTWAERWQTYLANPPPDLPQ